MKLLEAASRVPQSHAARDGNGSARERGHLQRSRDSVEHLHLVEKTESFPVLAN